MRLPISVGSVVANKYRVTRVLGEGGMGWVVAADHLQMPAQVAIKFLKQQASAEHLERFRREARSLAQLQSEHVARVLDVGTLSSGDPYIVMEYLDGSDLSRLSQQRGRLSVEQVADYICEACVGLAEAHALGIVHRDIKPANLFLATYRDGRKLVKVVDFGISKVNAAARGPKTGLTETGAFLGSPAFVSPEQLRSTRQVDARSDVWSLGASIYKMVAGRNVFEANSVAELAMAILVAPPPVLRTVVPDAPELLERIINKCLQRDPSLRYQNVVELAQALSPLGTRTAHAALAQISRAPPPPVLAQSVPPNGSGAKVGPLPDKKRRGIIGLSAMGVALVSGGALATWILSRDPDETEGAESKESPSKKKKKSKKDDSDEDNETRPASDSARSLDLPSKAPMFASAERIGSAVAKAHGAPLRVYDTLFFVDRARFVVESAKGGSLVRYEATSDALTGPEPHELSRSSRLDSLLMDVDILRLKNVPKIASDAPRRIGKASLAVYSVSLHRLSSGIVWSVALESGETARYSLNGNPVE